MIQLLLVGDRLLLRQALAHVLAQRLPDLVPLHHAPLTDALADATRIGQPRVILFDACDPADAPMRLLRSTWPDVPLIVLSHADPSWRVEEDDAASLLGGAAGLHDLVAALQTHLQAGESGASGIDNLSGRQRAVLKLLLQGRTNKNIGRALELSEATVKTHLQSIYRKLGVNTRSQAIVAATRLGWAARMSGEPEGG